MQIGKAARACVIFVQADTTNRPAVALHTKRCSIVEPAAVNIDIDVDVDE